MAELPKQAQQWEVVAVALEQQAFRRGEAEAEKQEQFPWREGSVAEVGETSPEQARGSALVAGQQEVVLRPLLPKYGCGSIACRWERFAS